MQRPPPQCLTTKYSGITRVLQNRVHVCSAFDPASHTSPINPQNCGAKEFLAIWDTGATNSVVSPKIAQECGLKPIGIVQVNTANGARLSAVYLVTVFLPNHVFFPQMRVTEGTLEGADVLLGMDIITKGDLAVTNADGQTTFSFRCPSSETIDFLKGYGGKPRPPLAANVPAKVGRNQPCPCGSGKKYKKCHGS